MLGPLSRMALAAATAFLSLAACSNAGNPGGAGGADCSGGPFLFACDQCIESSCCGEAATCYADAVCATCAAGTPASPAACVKGATPRWDALLGCAISRCAATCVQSSSCNPVTNDGCTDASEACDLNQYGAFGCFPAAAGVAACAPCSNASGPFCTATFHCISQGESGLCARYCCDDGDCGGGRCDTSNLPGGVGVCVVVLDGGVDPTCPADGGAGGPPSIAPSRGACFQLP
jgi:hypothetical protein